MLTLDWITWYLYEQGLLWETSLLDPEEGIRFRGYSIPELQACGACIFKLPSSSSTQQQGKLHGFYNLNRGVLPFQCCHPLPTRGVMLTAIMKPAPIAPPCSPCSAAQAKLPKVNEQPLPEGLLWLLMTGQVGVWRHRAATRVAGLCT